MRSPIGYMQPAYELPTSIMRDAGAHALKEGKVACIILAGGMGSRWGSGIPKGIDSISVFHGKSLFQVICERVQRVSKKTGQELFLAVMTSALNHKETLAYFASHNMFGLSVSFFQQEMLPFLDDEGVPIEGTLGPSGNGGAVRAFWESGLGKMWEAQGIKYVHIIPIDNVLADPFDLYACGVLVSSHADLVVKSILKKDPQEKVGTLIDVGGKLGVIEYSELPAGVDFVGQPAYIGALCMQMEFMKRCATKSLAYHKARKKNGGVWAWKQELFLFDLFKYADKWRILLYPREEIYAPLKDKEDKEALEAARIGFLNQFG